MLSCLKLWFCCFDCGISVFGVRFFYELYIIKFHRQGQSCVRVEHVQYEHYLQRWVLPNIVDVMVFTDAAQFL